MPAHIAQQPAHHHQRRDKRHRHTEAEGGHIAQAEQSAIFVKLVHRGSQQGGNGEEEGELGGGRAAEAEQHAANNRSTRAAGAGNERKRLRDADLQRVARTHVIDMVNAHMLRRPLLPGFSPEDHQGANDKSQRHRRGCEQPAFDGAGKQQAQNGSGNEADDHIDRKAPGGAAPRGFGCGQSGEHFADAHAVMPHHRQNGAALNRDFKHLGLVAHPAQQAGGENEVAGGGNRQKFGEALDQAENHHHDGGMRVHADPCDKRL